MLRTLGEANNVIIDALYTKVEKAHTLHCGCTICTYVCMYVCMHIYIYIYIYIYTIHMYSRAKHVHVWTRYISVYMSLSLSLIHTYMHTYMYTFIRTCLYAITATALGSAIQYRETSEAPASYSRLHVFDCALRTYIQTGIPHPCTTVTACRVVWYTLCSQPTTHAPLRRLAQPNTPMSDLSTPC